MALQDYGGQLDFKEKLICNGLSALYDRQLAANRMTATHGFATPHTWNQRRRLNGKRRHFSWKTNNRNQEIKPTPAETQIVKVRWSPYKLMFIKGCIGLRLCDRKYLTLADTGNSMLCIWNCCFQLLDESNNYQNLCQNSIQNESCRV